jgi:hypothetical protein
MSAILSNMYENIKSARQFKDIKAVQEYNLEQFLRSICDIEGRNEPLNSLVLRKDVNECFKNKNDCTKMKAEFESCQMMREEVLLIFRNRQYDYFEKLNGK